MTDALRRGLVRLAIICAVLTASFARGDARADDAASEPLRFRYANGASERIATRAWAGEEFVSVLDVSRLFACAKHWRADFYQMELAIEGRRVRLTLGSPVALIDGAAVLVPAPVQILDGVLWVPLRFVIDDLIPLAPNRAQWAPARNEIRVGAAGANVTRVRADAADDGASIEIETAAPLDADVALSGAREVTITLRGAVLPASEIPVEDRRQIIESIEAWGDDDGGRLVLRLASDVEAASVSARANPPGTVVRLAARPDSAASARLAAAGERERDSNAWDDAGEARPGDAAIRTLIIDPGHGGADRGATGASGATEKDLALTFALTLRERAERRLGLRTILTREADDDVAPERRATIANTSDGDLMVSIHCNAASDQSASGVELYVCEAAERNARGEDYTGAAAARAELLSTEGDLRILPWRAAHAPFLQESRRFADALGRGLRGAPSLRFRGVERGPLAALEGARMPAVQIELGFLTHAADEALLSSGDFRTELADAIITGIEEFMNEPMP